MKYVLYHANCYDGFGAAYAAWKKFGDEAKYIPVSYGSPPPSTPGATEIFVVDFSYSREVLLGLAERAPTYVLDHHKTAEEALRDLAAPNLNVIFDMARSGAKITWDFLHAPLTRPPRLIEHISDRDLWKFELPGSAKLHKALVSYPMDFKVWDTLDCDTLIAEGETCERLYTSLVKNICSSAWIGSLDGRPTPMVNTSIAWSEVGHELLEQYPDHPVVASFTVMKNSIMWSLRSRAEFDCSEIAKKFGGGGHKNASGFKAARY